MFLPRSIKSSLKKMTTRRLASFCRCSKKHEEPFLTFFLSAKRPYSASAKAALGKAECSSLPCSFQELIGHLLPGLGRDKQFALFPVVLTATCIVGERRAGLADVTFGC